MKLTTKELADLLISATSALNDGRQATASTKVAAVYKALHPAVEGESTMDSGSRIQEVSLSNSLSSNRPIIAGEDQFGPFLMFGEFRSAMPSSEAAHLIAHLLNGQSYCGQDGCPCGPVDPPHRLMDNHA